MNVLHPVIFMFSLWKDQQCAKYVGDRTGIYEFTLLQRFRRRAGMISKTARRRHGLHGLVFFIIRLGLPVGCIMQMLASFREKLKNNTLDNLSKKENKNKTITSALKG